MFLFHATFSSTASTDVTAQKNFVSKAANSSFWNVRVHFSARETNKNSSAITGFAVSGSGGEGDRARRTGGVKGAGSDALALIARLTCSSN